MVHMLLIRLVFLLAYLHTFLLMRSSCLCLHNNPIKLRVHNDKHWRESNTTCLTFLTTKETLLQTKGVLRTYKKNNYDASIWLSLTKKRLYELLMRPDCLFSDHNILKIWLKAWAFCWKQILFGARYHLWSPVPGIATHMEKTGISPVIDWTPCYKTRMKRHLRDV